MYEDLEPAKGMIYGLVLGIICWAIIIAIFLR